MPKSYDEIDKPVRGAWIVHHGQKTAATVNGAAEFPALDTAGKAASLLSQLASTDEATVARARVDALARAAGLNPRIEVPALLEMLKEHRIVDTSAGGDVVVLGLTTRATVGHAADIFDAQEPTAEERAAVTLAEATSAEPVPEDQVREFVADEFRMGAGNTAEFLLRSETVGFVDAEGQGEDKLYFNGNLFRRDNLTKVRRVLDSLSTEDQVRATELSNTLSRTGCVSVREAERIVGVTLFDKLNAAGMFDVNHVANTQGEHGYVTLPASFHKFNDPEVDDAFDLAKALVAALTYGMTQSASARGRISMIGALLRKLVGGETVGPATAIGEDYRILETKGVLRTQRAPTYGYYMRLLKQDVGEMALRVLTTGEAAAANAVERPMPGTLMSYSGPEATRWGRRKVQAPASKRMTEDVLQALRTRGGF